MTGGNFWSSDRPNPFIITGQELVVYRNLAGDIEDQKEILNARRRARLRMCIYAAFLSLLFGMMISWIPFFVFMPAVDLATRAVMWTIYLVLLAFIGQDTGTAWFEEGWYPFTRKWSLWLISLLPFVLAGWLAALPVRYMLELPTWMIVFGS